ncbi:hypothetical protein Trydic_g11184 [Trypoxylus dichotomus]
MAMFKAKLLSGVSSSPIGSLEGTVLNNDDTEETVNAGLNIKICTRNVRSVTQTGKVHNAINEMERFKIGILGSSEMCWPGSNLCDMNDCRVYYLETVGRKYEHGVGVLEKQIAKCATNFIPISERIILLQLHSAPTNINIVQVYAPTSQHREEEVKEFYSKIERNSQTRTAIIMGDFNARE